MKNIGVYDALTVGRPFYRWCMLQLNESLWFSIWLVSNKRIFGALLFFDVMSNNLNRRLLIMLQVQSLCGMRKWSILRDFLWKEYFPCTSFFGWKCSRTWFPCFCFRIGDNVTISQQLFLKMCFFCIVINYHHSEDTIKIAAKLTEYARNSY